MVERSLIFSENASFLLHRLSENRPRLEVSRKSLPPFHPLLFWHLFLLELSRKVRESPVFPAKQKRVERILLNIRVQGEYFAHSEVMFLTH